MIGRRSVALLALLTVLAAACDDGAGSEAQVAGTTVAGVTLAVPDGWRAVDEDPAPGVVAAQRWEPPDAEIAGLQLIVGCDEAGLDVLVEATLATARPPLEFTDAAEVEAPDVPGLDRTRRLELTFGFGRPDDRQSVLTSGLYGQAGEALVLVELTGFVAQRDERLVDEVLGSVRTDGDELRAACDASP